MKFVVFVEQTDVDARSSDYPTLGMAAGSVLARIPGAIIWAEERLPSGQWNWETFECLDGEWFPTSGGFNGPEPVRPWEIELLPNGSYRVRRDARG